MNNSILKKGLVAAFAFTTILSSAQDLQTSYILDNYIYSYRLNPSLIPYRTKGLVGVGVGNINADFSNTNVGFGDFFFRKNGKLVLGLNDAVSYDEFMGKLPDVSKINAKISENIFSYASTGRRGAFKTYEVNLRSDVGMSIPKEVFSLAKGDGKVNRTIKDVDFYTQNYLEIAIGRAYRSEFLAFGFRVKGLVGLARASMNISELSITTTPTGLSVVGNGSFTAAARPVSIGLDSDGYYDFQIIGFGGIIPSGFGGALDLGLSVYLLENRIQFGAGVRNLGAMSWTTDKQGFMKESDIIPYADAAETSIFNIARFKREEGFRRTSTGFKCLPMDIDASIKFKPVEFVSIGAVADMQYYNGKVSDFVLRYGAALTPWREFNLAASYARIKQNGSAPLHALGVAASIRLAFINLYVGLDNMIPFVKDLRPRNTISAGVGIVFGRSRDKFEITAKERKAARLAAAAMAAEDLLAAQESASPAPDSAIATPAASIPATVAGHVVPPVVTVPAPQAEPLVPSINIEADAKAAMLAAEEAEAQAAVKTLSEEEVRAAAIEQAEAEAKAAKEAAAKILAEEEAKLSGQAPASPRQ